MIANLKSKLKTMSSNCPSNEIITKLVDLLVDRGDFGGIVIQGTHGEFVLKRTVYAFNSYYGNIPLSDLLSATFQDIQWWTRLDGDISLEDIIFLDTETTGLAGGTGTIAFLIGLGYITKDGLVVEQYLMRDFDEELPMLTAVMDVLQRYKVLVTFNGKSFDWPLLESRIIYSRLRSISWEDAHLDLLHTARRLWSMRLDSCSLISLEENILGKNRIGDISGALIPNIYLDYLNTRKPDDMLQVIQHNEWDIIAMAAILAHITGLYNNHSDRCDAYELYGIARDLEREQRITEAAACYRACIDAAEKSSLLMEAKKHLGYLLKRHEGPQVAVDLWLDLAGREGNLLIFPLIEMAKFLEHKEKDYPCAFDYTEKALEIIDVGKGTISDRLKHELLNRKQRLIKKMERTEQLWG